MKNQQVSHNQDQKRQTEDFANKLSELAIEVLRTSITNKSLRIDYWVRLSGNPHNAWKIILNLRSIGIEVISTEQPLRLHTPFAKCQLINYIINPPDEED